MNDKVEQPTITKHVILIAGEASGDFLGANLMASLRKKAEEQNITLVITGIGGPRMADEGMLSLFPMHDLSVMGISEVLSALPRILKRLKQTKKYIASVKPDMLITIDSPDFCLRVAKSAKKNNPNLTTVHYVSPTVWAWREGRAKTISKFLDMILCLFPMEMKYYEKFDVIPKFVGHPLVQKVPVFTDEEKAEFFSRLKLNQNKPLLCVLPGSRRGEIKSLTPVFVQTVAEIRKHIPDLQVVVPTLQHFTEDLENAFRGLNAKIVVPLDDRDKFLAFSSSTAALHASGTVGLELALCNTPMVTGYKVSWLTGFIGKIMLKTKFVNLVNILLGHGVIKERLQALCAPSVLADDLVPLLSEQSKRKQQQKDLQEIRKLLLPSDGEQSSADEAAEAVLGLL